MNLLFHTQPSCPRPLFQQRTATPSSAGGSVLESQPSCVRDGSCGEYVTTGLVLQGQCWVGWPSVSIVKLREMESLVGSLYQCGSRDIVLEVQFACCSDGITKKQQRFALRLVRSPLSWLSWSTSRSISHVYWLPWSTSEISLTCFLAAQLNHCNESHVSTIFPVQSLRLISHVYWLSWSTSEINLTCLPTVPVKL